MGDHLLVLGPTLPLASLVQTYTLLFTGANLKNQLAYGFTNHTFCYWLCSSIQGQIIVFLTGGVEELFAWCKW